MRSPREEAIASIKAIQDKFMKAKGGADGLSNDQLQGMFAELLSAQTKLAENPIAAPAPRKMRFAGQYGDAAYRKGEMMDSLPKDVQIGLDQAYMVAKMLRVPVEETKSFQRLMDGSSELKKALDTAESGGGSDWIPTGFSSQLVAEVTQMGGFEQIHPHIVMPTNPYKLPLQLGRLTAYVVSEQTADSSQTAGTKSSGAGLTGNLTLTAVGMQAEVLTSKNLEEDSIVAIMPFLRKEIVMCLARAIEEATINGDTTATHMDTDIEAAGADDRRVAWKGYRKHALANSYSVDFQGAGNGFDLETINKVRAKLGKYGINPSQLVWASSLGLYFRMLSLKNTAGHPVVVTLDKFGAGATAISGQLGALGGSPVMVSEFCRDVLNASGVNDGVTTDRSALLCINKDGFVYGDRRDTTMQVLSELYAEYQQDALLVTMRKDFEPLRPIATNAAVAIGYNAFAA